MAKNQYFRELKSFIFQEHDVPAKFQAFFEKKIRPKLEFKGYKIKAKEKLALQMVHSLVTTGFAGGCVADTRDKTAKGAEIRIAIWDAIIEAGFARKCTGSESSKMQTRYRTTGKLLKLKKNWKLPELIDPTLVRNTQMKRPARNALIVLHSKWDLATGRLLPKDEQKLPLSIEEYVTRNAQPGPDGKPDPKAVENGMAYLTERENILERINRSNTSHAWQAFSTDPETGRQYVFPVDSRIREVHAGRLFRIARYYGIGELSGQNLSKAIRRTMRIDGEEVAELDFSGMTVRMLYHEARLDPQDADLYRPQQVFPKFYGLKNANREKREVVRGFIKRVTLICFNVDNREEAEKAVWKLLRRSNKKDRKLISTAMNMEGWKRPTSTVIDRVKAAHPDLQRHFFTGCGAELMTRDGQIMLHIMLAFVNAQKPILPIHDGLVCRVSDADFARQTMRAVYRGFTQFDPVITRAF